MSANQASDQGSSGPAGRFFKKLASTSTSTSTSKKFGKMETYVKKKLFNGRNSLRVVEYVGTAVVMKKLKVLDLIDRVADVEDDASEAILGKHVSVQLVSTELLDPKTGQAVVSSEVTFPGWPQLESLAAQNIPFHLKFIVPSAFGVPGAILVKNHHPNEFLLVSFTLDLPPDKKKIIHHAQYMTNSWVYNTDSTTNGRVFFRNKAYLPIDTPPALKELRERELRELRGNGKGERKESDRIYDYDIYNDLGKPDEDPKLERPNLGGNKEYPFPRRIRTGRAPTKANAKYESRSTASFYIPRDECFDRIKNSDFKATGLLSLVNSAVPKAGVLLTGKSEFESVEEIKTLFAPKGKDVGGLNNVLPTKADVPDCDQDPLVFLNEVLKADGQAINPLVYPLPRILQVDDKAWQKNEEFAREFLAGLNPVMIALVKEFPLKSSLNPAEFGDPNSAISKQHIEGHLEGLSVEQGVSQKKLFVADYHDAFLPFVARINAQENSAQYATRAMFFLSSDGTLKVLALELVLPPKSPGGAKTSHVLTPPHPAESDLNVSSETRTNYMWELAKAHVSNNDFIAHQVFSHFTRCHAAMEPVIIGSNRQLSKLHPIYQLMAPHFVNTLEINRQARETLIAAAGSIETNFTSRQYSLAMAAMLYRDTWTFESQALPNDLIARGMAVRDPSTRHGVKLVVEDYPYAADGLELWTAIKEWNTEYLDIYYKNYKVIQTDAELQNWWAEIRNQAHADKKDAPGWPVPNSKQSLVEILTTLQWIASCQHAALNFGQYDYAGFMPHHPTLTRRLLPEDEEGNTQGAIWEEWQRNSEQAYLKSISNIDNTATALSVYEVLSAHAPNEEYIGERPADWTENDVAKAAFKRFSEKVREVDELIQARNADPRLKNRTGVVQMPYQLMRPNSAPGVTFRGVPNSISI